jgi:putative ABC transport system permease protein
LTALGIIFGVSAVIAMLSIGEGAKQETLEQIQLMGINNIIVRAVELRETSFKQAKTSFSPGLTIQDAEAIQRICPYADIVVPQWEYATTGVYGSSRGDVRMIGVTPEYASVFNAKIKSGKFLTAEHIAQQANVCVLGSKAKESLFHFEDAVGKQVKLNEMWFTVVGVLEPKFISAKGAQNFDIRNVNLDIYIPITTAMHKVVKKPPQETWQTTVRRWRGEIINYIDRSKVAQITVKVKNSDDIFDAYGILKRILQRKHYGVEDYEITIPEELLRQSQKTQRIFNIVMGAIAGISLLVGGIGIMNIMLASVLERTREIGIRRAVGATKADVLAQFLIEAVVLSVIGGVIGVGLGFGMTKLITAYAEWKTIIDVWAVVLAFSVSGATGIAFGIYPAKKAAEKEPIEALRYE